MIWFFERRGERMQCEVRRDVDRQDYEFVMTGADGAETVERYDDPSAVISRSVDHMRLLIEDGWRSASGAQRPI
jgi:hypothetical protein